MEEEQTGRTNLRTAVPAILCSMNWKFCHTELPALLLAGNKIDYRRQTSADETSHKWQIIFLGIDLPD